MNKVKQIFSKERFIFILILFACCLLMSAASAVEADNNNLTSDSGDILLEEYDEAISAENAEVHSFDELSDLINKTAENEILTLENDYTFVNGSYKGIIISKSITIDGAGHTLDANRSSRIFNITADNVVLKNIKFINGNALGSYYTYYGGGAIHWNGSNGYLDNCSFIDNSALGVDYDPFDQEDEIIDLGDGMTMVIRHKDLRPDGRTINQGGAITWNGDNGTVNNCLFKNNHVAYPDNGGAIFWSGKSGRVIQSKFFDNSAYRGSAVYWKGVNGFISSSIFYNDGICDNGIFWTGLNGIIRNSILLSQGTASVISIYGEHVDADYNFWGDTIENPNKINKISGLSNWILLNLTCDKEMVLKNETFTISYDLNTLFNKHTEELTKYGGLANYSGKFTRIANQTSIINVSFENNRINVDLHPIGFFDELSLKINNTPEGGILVLDKDYRYLNGSNKGIIISKPITIDGAGHTLDGCELSRMFNVTSDNVTLRNINFVNGNAFGRYYAVAGGGAVYWNGSNGLIENCNFKNNKGRGIEDDPFDKEETWIDENGTVWHVYRSRPMGTKINEGGAIVWNGTDGVVSKCTFIDNGVGHPNTGGAICWRGANGKIMDCEFYRNDAWCGSAVAWIGDNGTILNSVIANSSFFDGIFWFGHNGTVKNSILLNSGRAAFAAVRDDLDLNVDYNFWGDTIEHPNSNEKGGNPNNWLLMKFTHNGEFIKKGQNILIKGEIKNLIDKKGNIIEYDGLSDKYYQFVYTAPETGYLNIYFMDGEIKVDIDPKDEITSKNVNVYYSDRTSFTVKVASAEGKAVNKNVKFTIGKKSYNVKTDKNGAATLKLKLKPGKYTVYTSYGNAKVKNTITVKSVLVTKDLKVKSKKAGKFTVKVLNSKGKAHAKQLVKIKFKGKTYKLKTNKKGIATFKVPKNLKVGKYTIKTTCKGLTNSNKIMVKK